MLPEDGLILVADEEGGATGIAVEGDVVADEGVAQAVLWRSLRRGV